MKKHVASLPQDDVDIAARYRITSLVRRRPYVNLLFAIDNQQQRPLAIRDIDITNLLDEARIEACEIVQQEYDLLRREHIPSIMPVIDLRHFQGHLYVIAGWPYSSNDGNLHLYTLQDVLQSGIGLPGTQVSLSWVEQICSSLDMLHRQQIVLGDLDPQALILSDNSYDNELILMVSWLPPAIRSLLPRTSIVHNATNFSAPEVLLGKPEPRSDIYSLGAVLYLLLTGIPPEEPMARMHRRLRPPAEFNSRINSSLDEFVMKALSIDSSERFPSAGAMLEALQRLRSAYRTRKGQTHPLAANPPPMTEVPFTDTLTDRAIDDIVNVDTISISPLPATTLAAWEAATVTATYLSSQVEPSPTTIEGALQSLDETDLPPQNNKGEAPSRNISPAPTPPPEANTGESAKNSFVHSFKQRISGILPAIPRSQLQKNKAAQTQATAATTFMKQLQRLVRGEQRHGTTAAAIIETPLRVQPNQSYTIRIQLMGRNEPGYPQAPSLQPPGRDQLGLHGLSALVEGELVHIEVRSALYQNYAYIVQQATVAIPAHGYAAEVTIPMQALSNGPSGRRDRLHIFFMDEQRGRDRPRRPLYEKPFVVELFISHLVQPGREGHNVLTIPL